DAVAGAWLDSRPLLRPNWYGDAFQGKEGPWLDEFTREFEATAYRPMRNRWQPYVYSRNAPFAGKYINIDERGLRRTINAPSSSAASQARKSLYFFGGSTLWGHGARDEYTIPSIVSRLLSEKGHAVEVTNFAQLAYVNAQEFITLVAELQHGRAPDVVIFFDGFNEVLSTVTNAEPGLSINEESRRREFKIGSQPADRLAALALRSTALCRLLGVS